MEKQFLNKVELVGIIGSIRTISVSDCLVLRLSLATEQTYVSNDSVHHETTWHNVSHWTDNKALANSLAKNDWVKVTGHLRNCRFTDPEGCERNLVEIVADTLIKLD